VPKIGIIGAAYATLASYAMGTLLTLILFKIYKKRIYGGHDD
jgi:Na+-driven multidrug efflux pump